MPTPAQVAATERVAAFIRSLDAETTSPAPGTWTVRLDCAGHPLELEVGLRGPFVRVRAAVLPAGLVDPHQLLFWNGQAPLVCFAEDATGEVLLSGELPAEQVTAELLDRFLGQALAAATRAREYAITPR